MKKVFIYKNDVPRTLEIVKSLEGKLAVSGIEVADSPEDVDLILCVGGDGTLL